MEMIVLRCFGDRHFSIRAIPRPIQKVKTRKEGSMNLFRIAEQYRTYCGRWKG